MINICEELRMNMDMDADTFYPMLITLLSIIVPFVVAMYKSIKDRFANNLLNLHCKRESDYFFGTVMLLELFTAAIVLMIYYMFSIVLTYLGINFKPLQFIVYFALVILEILFVSRRVFIRKRLLGEKKHKWLVCVPVLLYSVTLYNVCMRGEITLWCDIVKIFQIAIELWGMWHFQGRYIQYKYSSAKFYLNSGDIIDCKDLSKITRRYNSLIVQEENLQTRFKYDDISRVEYYGGCKVKILRK